MKAKELALVVVFVSLWFACIATDSDEKWAFKPVGRMIVTPHPRYQSSILIPKWSIQQRDVHRNIVTCGTHILSPGQTVTIQSKRYPLNYPRSHRCLWEFKGSSTASKISITCDDFVLRRCKYSSVRITGGDLDKKYCREKPEFTKISSNNLMNVFFRTSSKRRKGFSCRVSASVVDDTTTTSTTTTTTTQSTTSSGECKPCGTVNRVTRIVGGMETEVNEYPWQVALAHAGTNSVFCGGSLLNDLLIFSAAHCITHIIQHNISVEAILGAHDLNNPPASQQRIPVANSAYHSRYNTTTYDNDIGVLWLEYAAELSDDVKPVCLPDPSKDYSGYTAITSGWGTLTEGGSQPTTLNAVDVPVISNADCNADYGGGITDNMICAGHEQGGKDTCQGDSGGPLAVEDNGTWDLIGVTSWGYGCGSPGFPGVYARVSKYLSIIESVMTEGSNNLCSGETTKPGTTTTTATTTTRATTKTTTTPATEKCLCGRRNPITKIVGGMQTTIHEYPWQVGLTETTGTTAPYCGGSIISNQHILTAAHCVQGNHPSTIIVLVGEHNWQTAGETAVTSRETVSQVIVHPNYNADTVDNDLALLRLSSPITFPSDNTIAPVCLPTAGNAYDNVDAIVTGWGTLSSGGSQPSNLNEVTVPTMSNTLCRNSYGSSITANMICAGLQDGGKDSCQGDSGGPMITAASAATTAFYEQIGIVSWGSGCAEPNKPGVYTRVTRYLSWINEKISGSMTCDRP